LMEAVRGGLVTGTLTYPMAIRQEQASLVSCSPQRNAFESTQRNYNP